MSGLKDLLKQYDTTTPENKDTMRSFLMENEEGAIKDYMDNARANDADADWKDTNFFSQNEYNPEYLDGTETEQGELDVEEYRAQVQPFSHKVGRGLSRLGSKIGFELAKIPGYAGGFIGAVGNEMFGDGEGSMDMFVNNSWIKAIEEVEDYMNNELIPVYVKKSVRDGNLWDNITSIDFWSTEGADGLAFMLSMLAPGAAISKIGAGSKILSTLGKSKKGMEMLSKMDKASKAVGLNSAGQALDFTAATVVNTLFESGSEANHAMKGLEEVLQRAIANGDMTEQEAQAKKGQVGRDVFVSNLAILMLPNAILNKQLLGFGKQSNRLSKFKISGGEITQEVAKRSLKENLWEYGGKIIGANVLREGFFEEGMQSTVEEYWRTHDTFKADELFDTYLDVLGTTNGQKAIFLGGLFGSGAATVGNVMNQKRNKKRDNAIINAMNASISFYENSIEGFAKKDEDGNILYDEDMNVVYDYGKLKDNAEAIQNIKEINERLTIAEEIGDKDLHSLIMDRLESNLISTFIKAGEDGIAILKEKLQDSKAYNESIQRNNQREGTEKINRFESYNEVEAKATKILKDYEFFNNYGKILTKFKVNKENKEVYSAFVNGIQNSYIQTNSQIRKVKEIVSKLETEYETEKANILADFYPDDVTSFDPINKMLLDALKDKIDGFKAYGEELQAQLKSILNPKVQKEAFQIFKQQYEETQETQKKVEESKKTSMPSQEEEKFQEDQATNEEVLATEKKEKKDIKIAKDENNKFYDVLATLFENPNAYNLIKDKDGEVTNLFGQDHIKPLQEHIKIPPAHMIAINKIKSKDDPIYTITVTEIDAVGKTKSEEIIEVHKFHQIEEKVQEAIEEIPVVENSDINNNDAAPEAEINVDNNKKIEEVQIIEETNEKTKKSVSKKHIKTVLSNDSLFTSPEFKEYLISPRDKRGDKFNISLGYEGMNNKAVDATNVFRQLYNTSIDVTKEQLELMYRSLPLKIKLITNGDIYTHLFMEDGTGKFTLDEKEYNARKKIIDSELNPENRNKQTRYYFEGQDVEIKFQFPGEIQLDRIDLEIGYAIPTNPITEIYGMNKIDDIKLIYSDRNGRLLNTIDDTPTSLGNVKHAGTIFMEVPMANGRIFPLKLNMRRLNEQEATYIYKIAKAFVNRQIKVDYKSTLASNLDVLELNPLEEFLKKEAKVINRPFKEVTIGDIFQSVMFEGNTKKNMVKITNNTLTIQGDQLTLEDLINKESDVISTLMSMKNRNVRKDLLDQQAYKKFVLEDILSTDVKLGAPVFQGNTNIYVDLVSEKLETETNKTEDKIEKFKTKKSKKGKTRRLGNIKKGISNMKKDDDNNSETIC